MFSPPASVLVGEEFLFIGRMHGLGPEGGTSMHAQTAVALARIERLLKDHGLGFADVTQARYLVPYETGHTEFGSCALLLQQAFGDPRPRLTQVAPALFPPGAVIQIEVRARRG